jgi:dTDP-4-dehydrorhamnose reductase
MTMRLLVLGSGGMLGRAVVDAAARLGHDAIGLTHAELDITDAAHVARVVAAAEPGAVVNCAAYTDVDGSETNEARAHRVNADGAGNASRAAAEAGARIVHVSTDYVFDGTKREPWVESDPVGPLQAYGRSKLAGERAVADANPEHAIVRAAWLFGTGGPSFAGTMLRLGAERDEVSVVTDQRGRPTWTGHLAPALVELTERRGDVGVLHATGPGECSWYELAVELFHRVGMPTRVLPTTSATFARPAARPAYSVLGSERDPAVVLPPWEEGLEAWLRERAATVPAA